MAKYNTVPSGQIGTGAAFLLGGSKALDNWISQDQRNSQVRTQNARSQAEFDQNLGKSYATNAFKGVPGQMWNSELQSKIDEHVRQGSEYLAQGVDIYNPNFRDKAQVDAYNAYQRDRGILNSMLDAQKQFQKDADQQQTLRKGDPYAYTPESQQAIDDFEQGTSLYDAVTNGVKYPSLEKVFDYNKNITEQIPVMTKEETKTVGNDRITEKVANVPAIERAAKNLLTTGAARNWVEKQIGGSVDGLLNTIDEKVIRKQLDDEFKSPSSMEMFAELKNKGKVPGFGTPQYNKFLDDAVKEQLNAELAFDKILSGAVQDGIGKANPTYKKVADFSLARERRAIEARNEGRVRFAERNDEKTTTTPEAPEELYLPFAGGKGNVRARNYVRVPMPAKNFAGSSAIDMYTGKPIKLDESSNNYSVVGVDNFPVLKEDFSGKNKGVLVQPDFEDKNPDKVSYKPMIHVKLKKGDLEEDFLVPYDRMPQNLTKANRAALANFKPATNGKLPSATSNSTTTPTKGKEVPLSKVKALIGKPGYEGYTEKELVDYYKSQGYNIK